MLQLILMITIGVPNPGLMGQAYSHWLNYKVVDRGEVSTRLATVWGAPAMAHQEYVTLQPASGAKIYLRFVRVDPVPGYVPMRTTGWNAIESFVQNPDGLARRLSAVGSPFKIEGQPRPLGPNSLIRAMQVRGPGQEILYLTHVPNAAGQPPHATTYVDRPFVMVVGGTNLDAMRQFYHDLGATTDDRTMQARITVLNKAFGLDINTTHPITMARVSPQYSIEIDGYPAQAKARATSPNELPPGIAMVSFKVDSLAHLKLRPAAAPRAVPQFPYQGRRVAVIRGPAGELVELVGQAK